MSAHDDKYTQTADGWIETFTGRRFYFADPKPEMIELEDIAQALSKLCRYNGHCRFFYSVAEHSVVLARWYLSTLADDPTPEEVETAYALLMHDSGEAYLCDVPRPIKAKLPDYKVLEEAIERAIAHKYGLAYPHPKLVKEADGRIIVDERQQVMNPSPNDWAIDGLEGLGVVIGGWEPVVAYLNFIQTHTMLNELRRRG